MASRLSPVALRALPVGAKITEAGVVAERGATGITFSVNIAVDGARIHRRGFANATQARQFIEQARADARAGRLSLPKGRKLALTFAAAAENYLARLGESGGKSLMIKRRQLRMYLTPYFGALRLDQINPLAVERFKRMRREAGAAPATVNRELATLSHLLNRALEWGWIDRLPARPKKYEEAQGRVLVLDDQQVDALMAAAIASADSYLWLFVAIALGTSMRHAEILAARWDQLDLARRRLYIPRAKAGQREQPITAGLVGILEREKAMRTDKTGFIFPARNADSGSGHLARIDRSFREAARSAGLDPAVTPHTLRHTAITRLVQAGVDLPTVQRISGHKTLAMVLRYSHVSAPHIDAAITALENRTTPKLHQAARMGSRPKLVTD